MEMSQLHAPAALPPGKNLRYSFYGMLGESQTCYGRGGREIMFQPLPGIETRSSNP
jgi:hypothetical protein